MHFAAKSIVTLHMQYRFDACMGDHPVFCSILWDHGVSLARIWEYLGDFSEASFLCGPPLVLPELPPEPPRVPKTTQEGEKNREKTDK